MPDLSETAVNAIAGLARGAITPTTIKLDLTQFGRSPIAERVDLIATTDANGKVTVSAPLTLIEPYLQRPVRRTGTAVALTAAAFIDLVNRHKGEHSVIFGNPDWRKPSATAVIDYHDAAEPGDEDTVLDTCARHCQHRISYTFPLDEVWQAWVARDGKAMSQTDFAEWIEDHITEITSPTQAEVNEIKANFGGEVAPAAKIMELSRGLKIFENANIRNEIRLSSGEGAIQFEVTHKDQSGEPIRVPEFFMLSIPAFVGALPTRLPVRLRYRVKDGSVTWIFKLLRPDLYISGEVAAAFQRFRAAINLPLFEGTPEI